MCHQTNLRFYDDLAYDRQYKGLILDGYEGELPLPQCSFVPVHASQHDPESDTCTKDPLHWSCLLLGLS